MLLTWSAWVVQGSSGFRNACITDSGALGGELIGLVTPRGVQLAGKQGQNSSQLQTLSEVFGAASATR